MALTAEEEAELAELEKTHGSAAASGRPAARRAPMIASYSEYLKKKAVAAPDAGAQAALKAYETEYIPEGTADLPLTPEENASAVSQGAGAPSQEEISQGLSHARPAREAAIDHLISKLDPMHPLPPQGHALMPKTTHPQGDEFAKNEWVQGDLSNPSGTVVVYDAPLAKVREDLAANPKLLEYTGLTISPGSTVEKGDAIEQAYQDHFWQMTANDAAEAGKTAYRQSRAPWLGDGKGATVLQSLQTKLGTMPASGPQAFVMGYDDTANFGIGRAAQESGAFGPSAEDLKYMTGPKRKGPETAGGIPEDTPARERNAMVEEENPGLHTAGQVAGVLPGLVEAGGKLAVKGVEKLATKMGLAEGATAAGNTARRGLEALSEWNLSNGVFDFIMGKAPTTLAGSALSVVKAGGANMVGQGITEGARAASNYSATGDTGTTLSEAGGRMVDAGKGGALLHSLAAGSGVLGRKIRAPDGFYKGAPGDIEKLNGGEGPNLIAGYSTPKVVQDARDTAAARIRRPATIDIFAENLQKPLAKAAKEHEGSLRQHVGTETSKFQATPEGRALLPATELATDAYSKLKKRNASIRGALPTPVGTPNADKPIKGVFNANIEGISTTPREGWIKMPINDAAAYLTPTMRMRGVKAARDPGRVMMRPGAGERAERATAGRAAEGEATTELATNKRYHTTPLDRLPSGEEQGLATVDRYRDPRTRALNEATPQHPGAAHPELQASDTRFSPEGPDHRRVYRRYEAPTEDTGGGPLVRGSREARPGERSGRPPPEAHEVGPRGGGHMSGERGRAPGIEAEPASIPDAEFTEKRARFKPKDAPNRTTRAKPATAEGKARQQASSPRSFIDEMRKAGVKTVYVAPRRYNAMHHESAIGQVRRKGQDTVNDRDLTDFYHAALRDRDARSLGGKRGGWSEMQQRHAQGLSEAKETRKLAAPTKRGAYDAVVSAAAMKPGQSEHIQALEATAKRAGGNALEMLRGGLLDTPLANLQRESGFGKSTSRMRYGPSALIDFGVLRGLYPVTRTLEGAHTGKLQLLREDSSEKKRREQRRDEHRPGPDAKSESRTKRKRTPWRRSAQGAK